MRTQQRDIEYDLNHPSLVKKLPLDVMLEVGNCSIKIPGPLQGLDFTKPVPTGLKRKKKKKFLYKTGRNTTIKKAKLSKHYYKISI